MDYVELNSQEIMDGLTNKPASIFEPVLDELLVYRNQTQTHAVEWAKVLIDYDDLGLKLEGLSIHPYVQWRLTNYIMNISKAKMNFWEENPDLWVQLIQKGIGSLGEFGHFHIVDDQVVALSVMKSPLYDHLDFIEPMVKRVVASHRLTGHPVALAGFQVDPVWTHVRVVNLSNMNSTRQIGYQLDANYLFKKNTRRAFFAPFLKDLKTESTLNLESIWTVNSPKFSKSVPDFKRSFDRAMKKSGEEGLVSQYRKALVVSQAMNENYADRTWRQGAIVKYQSQGVGAKRLGQQAAKFRQGSRLEFVLLLLEMIAEYPLDRRIIIENVMAKHLLEGIT